MAYDFTGKTILVTGAGQGIGRAISERLDELGAKVYAVSKTQQNLDDLKANKPNITIRAIDLSKWDETRTKLADLVKGVKFDGLVNNAAVAIIKPFADLTEKDFDDTIDINLKSVFNVTQILLPNFNEGASIVNLSSLASFTAFAGHSIYSATKGAIDSLTRAFTLEFADRKIRANSLNPTVIMTQMSIRNWSDPAKANGLKSRIPLRRFAEVEEIVEPTLFLLSDRSSFINGHSVPIEGGFGAI